MKGLSCDQFSARSVTFYRGSHCILRNVSLSVGLGECVALVGPNGAGKSSLLKIFSGDLRPRSGEVVLDGIPLTSWNCQKIAQRRAVLPQESELLFPLSVWEVILMGRLPYHSGKESFEDEKIAEEASRMTDIATLWDRPYNQLSGGQKQRVQLARVLAQVWPRPAAARGFLLLDEPISSLDLAHQHAFFRTVRHFVRAGLGVLVVLHDLNFALRYANRVMVLHKGCAVACGAPARVLQPQLVREVFSVEMRLVRAPSPILVPLCDGGDEFSGAHPTSG